MITLTFTGKQPLKSVSHLPRQTQTTPLCFVEPRGGSDSFLDGKHPSREAFFKQLRSKKDTLVFVAVTFDQTQRGKKVDGCHIHTFVQFCFHRNTDSCAG